MQKFVKDARDYHMLNISVKERFLELKGTHLVLAAQSFFPSVSMNDFTSFSRKAKLQDLHLKQSTIDRLFITTNFEAENQPNNPDKQLIRFEFIELLIRIAGAKYKETGVCKTWTDAFEKLWEDNILPASEMHLWQGFRDQQLYTVEVNDLFMANDELIRKVYQRYYTLTKKYMSAEDAIELFCNESDCGLTNKEAQYCHAMSKMTNPNENDNSERYTKLQYPEFLEMIGRVAELKYRGSENEPLPLAEKIETVLDQIFVVLGPSAKRKDVDVDMEILTESDSDY